MSFSKGDACCVGQWCDFLGVGCLLLLPQCVPEAEQWQQFVVTTKSAESTQPLDEFIAKC
eukprot:5274343-Amphidinium_carterae.1